MALHRLPQALHQSASLRTFVQLQHLVELPMRRGHFERVHRRVRQVHVERAVGVGEIVERDVRLDPGGAVERLERRSVGDCLRLAPLQRREDVLRHPAGGVRIAARTSISRCAQQQAGGVDAVPDLLGIVVVDRLVALNRARQPLPGAPVFWRVHVLLLVDSPQQSSRLERLEITGRRPL